MMVENEVNIFFPIEPQVGSRATPATIGGSLKNLLAAARQKPAEPKAEELEAKPDIPVSIPMKSAILGTTIDVNLWSDKAMVDGVPYFQTELADLLSRGLSMEDLRAVHEVKKAFAGQVVKPDQAQRIDKRAYKTNAR